LLKLNPRVSQLALYDIRLAPGKLPNNCFFQVSRTNEIFKGVAADIGHINTKSEV
jgi:hypothetical protein